MILFFVLFLATTRIFVKTVNHFYDICAICIHSFLILSLYFYHHHIFVMTSFYL